MPPSPHMPDGTDLVRWADLLSARADFPRLIRRLIRHENDQVQRLEMRAGEGIQLPGFDGIVRATRGTPFVPEGLSVWEMGVNRDPAAKATADYKTRTDNSLGVDKATTTFVFVTPRRWPKKKDWEQARREEGVWHDVRVLDADDIELALDECPADRIWLAELLDIPALGAATIEDWWQRYSGSFNPTLKPAVVLAGREDEAAALLGRLSEDVGQTIIRAATVDDGLAFVACTMLAQEPAHIEPMVSRSLVVNDGITLRRLETTSRLLILLPYEESLQRQANLVRNHHVVLIVTEGDAQIELPPLDHFPLEAALREAGVLESDLTRYIRAGTKSLSALQRVSSAVGQPVPRAWASTLADRALRRAWLAGRWNHLRSGDVAVIAELTGINSEDIESTLQAEAKQSDPIFTHLGSIYAVADPLESWSSVRHQLGEADLAALERAVQDVLGAIDPRLELPPSERWTASLFGVERIHSAELRLGLARSVALLGVHGDEVRLPSGRSARQWAESVVWQLLNRANEERTGQLWSSLQELLALLAEAAPDVFLRAVTAGTSGEQPLLETIFQDSGESGHVSSPHTGLLWALESVAWSEQHFGLAVELLARLGELDPGGRLSNRPMASLLDIFRPWLPQTSAHSATRALTLYALVSRHESLSWALLLDLLPEPHMIGSYTRKPQFRDWASHASSEVSPEEFGTAIDSIVELLIQLAARDPVRWPALIDRFDRLSPRHRASVVAALQAAALDDETLQANLRSSIEEFARKHRQFSDAEWALSEESLAPLLEVLARLAPPSPTEQHAWLFDSWHPDIGLSPAENLEEYDSEVRRLRGQAASHILAEDGLDALIRLAQRVKLPWSVGAAVADSGVNVDDLVIPFLEDADAALAAFAEGYTRSRSSGLLDPIRSWILDYPDRPRLQARLLQGVISLPDSRELLAQLGESVESAYWAEFQPYGRGADFPHVNYVAKQLLRHDRVAMSIHTLSMYTTQGTLDVALLREALERFGTFDDPEASRVSEFDLSRLLQYLRDHGQTAEEVAPFEWKFLPVFRQADSTSSLQELMARDPQWFVQVASLAFRRATADADSDADQGESSLATNAYRLLRDWRIVPGTQPDGTVDAELLNRWLEQARSLLAEADRLEIGELQIGEVLAHAPYDPDGTFPARPVRDVLEAALNDRLETGFLIGLRNQRGFTTRGMTDGGAQEYELAKNYERLAELIHLTHPRTAQILRTLAESYRDEGRRNDEDARRFLEGLDR